MKTNIRLLVSGISLLTWMNGFGQSTFTKITSGSIVNDGGSSAGCAWGDYNNDGFDDLFVANNNGEDDFLYQNDGNGSFSRITTAGVGSDGGNSVGCSWADYDNDGYLDLFVANGGAFTYQASFLYHNNGDGTFTRILSGSIVIDLVPGFGGAWADYDNDGYLDLFLATVENQIDSLYRNNGNGTFDSVTLGPLVNTQGNSIGAAWADYNNDGRPDLFVANGPSQTNFLYRNEGGGDFLQDYQWIHC